MRVVVADTSPLHYLVLIGAIDVLPRLFTQVIVPTEVHDELQHEGTPPAVSAWATALPAWVTVQPAPAGNEAGALALDDGERAAIALASSLPADLVLMDDRRGVAAALARGLEVAGTLAVLARAARSGMIDLEAALTHLKATNFRYRPEILDALIARHRQQGGS